jgi:type I pantothenate kinase
VSAVTINPRSTAGFSPYAVYPREEWAKLRADMPMPLTDAELENLSGLIERISVAEVIEVYLPLSRLLNLYVEAVQALHSDTEKFLRKGNSKMPFIIGLAGSVAAGKSTTARVLQALLARWPSHRRVDLVPTDGFLFPNEVLQERGIMDRKGFPESYDLTKLLNFLAEVKSGQARVEAPVYSHLVYDVLPDQRLIIERPDIVVVEGLNVLQPAKLPKHGEAIPYVSDFFDFSIYIDAAEELVEGWYVERFLRLRQTSFRDPASYFHRYASLSEEEARETALSIWRSINLINLTEHILPTRQRADLILRKGADHAVENVALRKL